MLRTMRTTILAAAAALAMLTPAAVAFGNEPLATNYLVGFHGTPPVAPGDDYMGGTVLSVTDGLNFAVVRTLQPALFEARARMSDEVRYVDVDQEESGLIQLVPNDALYGNAGHYGSKKIGAEVAWDLTLGSTGVKVATIDTGLNKAHEEYAGQARVLQGWDFRNGDNDPNDEKGGALYGCNYHGTHTIGTAGATINNGKGIAGISQHTILPIKALGGSTCGSTESALANSLKYAADQGAHVVSNSWRWPSTTTLLLDAIDYTFARGTIIVSAAGNNGPCTNCVENPWKQRVDKVIIVASTDSADKQSSFSSEGPEVDLAAPGTGILSTTSGTTGYSSYSGTSMATPHVAGVAALIKALNPTYGYAEIDARLKGTAVDLGVSGFDTDFGFGRLNAAAAVN